jgi:hypothetical protein
MRKQGHGSTLVQKGCRSYREALFVIMQFRHEVQAVIRAAIDERLQDIARSMKLDKAKLRAGLSPHQEPTSLDNRNWDGSNTEVGFKYPGRPWEAGWCIYFYLWSSSDDPDDPIGICAWFWLQRPGKNITKLRARGLDWDANNWWLYKPLREKSDLAKTTRSLLDRWISIWTKAGGIRQFIPRQRAGRDRTTASS